MKIYIDNCHSTLSKYIHEIDRAITVSCENYFFSQKYKSGLWDGKHHFLKSSSLKFPTGLLNIVIDVAKSAGLEVELIDNRQHPFINVAKNWNDENSLLNGIEMRDYQLDALVAAIESERGCLEMATASGKTEVAAAIIKVLGLRTIFLVHTRDLLRQAKERFEIRLGEDIGMLGEGVSDLAHHIVVATVQSVDSWLKKDERAAKNWLNTFSVLFLDECLDGETQITTPLGETRIQDIKPGDIVSTPTGTARVVNVWTTHKQSFLYRGCWKHKEKYLIASSNHVVVTKSGLKSIGSTKTTLRGLRPRGETSSSAYLLGWFIGDGTYPKDGGSIKFGFRKDVEDIKKLFAPFPFSIHINSRGDTVFHLDTKFSQKFAKTYGLIRGKKSLTVVIPQFLVDQLNIDVLRGIVDAEGYIDKTHIIIETTSVELMKQVKSMLYRLGIQSNLKTYNRSNPCHAARQRLSIYGKNIEKFMNVVGLGIRRKKDIFLNDEIHLLPAISLGVRKLYDIEIDDDNKIFLANGMQVHNCHHASARTWERICLLTQNAYFRFGLSGTILRRDDLSNMRMLSVFGPAIYRLQASELIKRGYLSGIVVNMVDNPEEVEGFAWQQVYSAGVVESCSRNAQIIRLALEEFRLGRRVMILVRQIRHGEILMAAFASAAVPAVFLHGSTDSTERESEKKRFNIDGNFILIASVIFDEGVDIPEVNTLIIAAGGKSEIRIIQRVGRGLRKKTDGGNLIVYDFMDSSKFLRKHSAKRLAVYRKEQFIGKGETL